MVIAALCDANVNTVKYLATSNGMNNTIDGNHVSANWNGPTIAFTGACPTTLDPRPPEPHLSVYQCHDCVSGGPVHRARQLDMCHGAESHCGLAGGGWHQVYDQTAGGVTGSRSDAQNSELPVLTCIS
ncbi:hypothetical protein DERF_004727 [Dermatophagoides farinae]|uniref:Uncharacterized protein n=1 Tax=Dermatophagoides farinae TaxID=6954 RepID=A0A922L6H1_DERFA|nr:hypothetical protein DERF_004727 [Dermatophagoides farinae]